MAREIQWRDNCATEGGCSIHAGASALKTKEDRVVTRTRFVVPLRNRKSVLRTLFPGSRHAIGLPPSRLHAPHGDAGHRRRRRYRRGAFLRRTLGPILSSFSTTARRGFRKERRGFFFALSSIPVLRGRRF